jgi:hypothetical protein
VGEVSTGDTGVEKGKLPEPVYYAELPDSSIPHQGEVIKWIGMKAFALDGTVKDFLWFMNARIPGLNEPEARQETAEFIASVKLQHDTDIAVGRAVDVSGSDPVTQHVKLLDKPAIYGYYVEAEQRFVFSFRIMRAGVETAETLHRQQPEQFEHLFQGALDVLPLVGGVESA